MGTLTGRRLLASAAAAAGAALFASLSLVVVWDANFRRVRGGLRAS